MTTSTMYRSLLDAAITYRNRRDGTDHPDGTWHVNGTWRPSIDEEQPCCARIRPPSRAWPRSLLRHCCTIVHVARLCGVDEAALRREVRRIDKEAKGK